MTNEVSVSKEVMSVAFTNAKEHFRLEMTRSERKLKDKTVVRSEIGLLISGKGYEREEGAHHVMLRKWSQNKLCDLALELNRVFPSLEKKVENFNKKAKEMLAVQPELHIRVIDPKGGKVDLAAMVALATGITGANKGEKKKVLDGFRLINEYEGWVKAEITRLASLPALEAA